MSVNYNKKVMLWFDTETTGLDPDKHRLLEIAFVLTDNNLVPIDQFEVVVEYDPAKDPNLSDWCKEQHHNSGLFARCRGELARPIADIDSVICNRLRHHVSGDTKLLLCGNTIGFDRGFIKKEMPKLESLLHYRMIDVSATRTLLMMAYGNVARMSKSYGHRAMSDVLETIGEAHFLLKHFDFNKFKESLDDSKTGDQ